MKTEAKKRFAKFVNSLFAVVLVVGLMPTWALSNPTPAYAAPGDVTVSVTVNGLEDGTLPDLVSGTDFTVGQAVNADPAYYTDAQGNMPLADLITAKAAQGYTLKWYNAEDGTEFDWNSTKVTRSITVEGKWEVTQCTVTVAANDGSDDKTVIVPWGKSYGSITGGAPATPSKKGWQFLGWYTQDGNQYDFNSAVTESVTVEAKWAVADVTIVPTTNPFSDVKQTLTGTVWIGSTWSLHPAKFALSNFSGELAGCSVTGECADHSAAQPTNVRANYTATLKSVNTETGEVIYDVYITPPGVTDGHSRNKYGLIGYQHVSAQVKLIKNFGGWIEINKSSANTDITDNNDCYSIEGAEYAVYDKSGNAVSKLTTDKNGYAKTGLLPSGSYTIKELKAPKGYAIDAEAHPAEVKSGQTTTTNLKDEPTDDPITVLLDKYDGEKAYSADENGNLPIGGAKLYGAQYSIEYYDGYYNTVSQAEASGDPVRKWVMQTDETGSIMFAFDGDSTFDVHDSDGNVVATLPYKVSGDDFFKSGDFNVMPLGTVVVKEIKAPQGYNLPEPFGQPQSFVRQITSNDVTTPHVHSYNMPTAPEPVYRSDLEFTKAASDDAHSLANVPFKITSKTTGESHVIVTDENGKASTKASWNKHTQDTNGNDWVMTGPADAVSNFLAEVFNVGNKLDSTSGVWFGQYQDGDETKITDPDDERGALPYDSYTLEELPCASNEGYHLIKKDFTVSRDNTFNADNTVNLGTLTDQKPTLSTQAYDKADGDQEVVAEPDVTIVDKISCDNLSTGTEYVINGTLMDKTTGEPYVDASGNEVHGSITFTAKSQEQDVYVEFTFDGSNLTDSTELVCFEKLATTEDPDRILDSHEDITDQGQTVTVKPPMIGTIATDGVDGDKDVIKDTQMTVKDTVAYVGLTVGREYTLKGELMDKATGTVLKDAQGNPVTAEKKFTPKTTAGTVDIEFTFDGSLLNDGDALVAFEHVSYKQKEIATHAEIDDLPQTVTVSEPNIKTTAVSGQAGHEGDKNVVRDTTATITDTVKYENVVPGKEYTVDGTLMDKTTGKALTDKDGNEITSSATFTPNSKNGTVDVTFTFDAANLEGKDLVVFETLKRGDTTITEHKDLKDENQTVTVVPPEIGTTAVSSEPGHEGDKNVVRDTQATVKDTVEYKGLVVGKTYTVSGTLVYKKNGEPVLNADGSKVTAEKTFTANDTYGSVELEFTFDAAALDGEEIVAFEKLYQDGKEVGGHEDISDEGQTVTVVSPELKTTAIDAVDGDKNVVKDPEATVTDTVEYDGLIPGREYTVVGKIMDKATGEAYIDPTTGEEIVGSTTFTPKDTYGTIDVEFNFDASQLEQDAQLVVFESLQREGEEVGDHSDINDDAQAVTVIVPEVHTTATDGLDGDKEVPADHKATVVDAVQYKDLVPGKEYTVSGTLMVKETGKALLDADGNPITGSTTFTPEKSEGSVDVVFEFDADLLAGKKLVAFEKLLRNDIEITFHEDIDDEDQTVEVVPPKVGTTATDTADGDKHMSADPESSITDEIAYKNLIPGDEYQVAGILMDKSTGLPLLSGEGASAISTEDLQKFADDLKAACGLDSGDVSAIEIDGKAFGEGHEVKLVDGKYEWSDDNGSGQYLEKTDDGWKLVEFSDSADMSNSEEIGTYTDDQVKLTKDAPVLPLSPDYEAIAKVMQENPDIVSCLSLQKKTFTPEEQSGTVSMDFPINSIYNEDTDTVVFEFLFKGSELIANESDLGNEGQTVSIVTPKLSTTATDKTDGDHTLLPSREATVVDHVEYTDLIPGKEYTVSGTLMDKSTGEPLVVGDGNVTAETTFVPNKADGTVDLEFTFDASELGGKDLVAFEIAYKDGIQIADHQDIDDEAQTVTVSEPDDNTFDTPGGDGYSKTGVDMTLIYALIAALVVLAGGAGAYAYRHRKLAAAEGKTDSESDEE